MRKMLAFLAAVAALLFAAGATLRRSGVFPVRVAGQSMLPTLRPGEFLAVAPMHRPPRHGALVVVRAEEGVEVVKRVAGGPGEDGLLAGQYWLLGDNPQASTDSRTHGPYEREQIVGLVRARYWPPARLRVFTW